MKKSEMYRAAQVAVLKDAALGYGEKIDILRELIEREDMELFIESEAAKNGVQD